MLFGPGCGARSATARVIRADVDRRTPQIVFTNRRPSDPYPVPGERVKPIRFPWTVSLTDPLYRYIVATAHRCLCTWGARIDWVSGSARGEIPIINHGKGYHVAGDQPDLGEPYEPGGNGHWERR